MTLQHIIEREREIAAAAAAEAAREDERNRVNRLYALLLDANRIEDLKKATKDPEYQKKLFEEFDF